MRKAVLVIDMPDTCGRCQLCQGVAMDGEYVCSILDEDGNERGYDDGKYDKPDWCPLTVMHEHEHGHWYTLTDCANAGTYCSVCNKKVYKEHYANVKPKSKFCPHCGGIMDGEFIIL